MSVRIRLRRVGRKKQPSYRIVVAESSNPRSGVYIENVGFYNPRRDPMELRVNIERVDHWIEQGAGLTPTVASLVRRVRRGELGEVISDEPTTETPEAAEAEAETPATEAEPEAPTAGAEAETAAAEASTDVEAPEAEADAEGAEPEADPEPDTAS